ncbi:MAG TPA: insulinase family protein [Firmicutes bacterium]|nr:insulinase family protein [Bacillota bacterium]
MPHPSFQPLSRGAGLLTLTDGRFKTARLTAALLLPLAEETAGEYAILPYLLRRSCEAYPDFTALKRRLNELYGARITAEVTRLGECQALVLHAVSIDDRFALHGEEVAAACAALLSGMLFRPALENGVFPDGALDVEKRCLIEQIESEINEKRLYARHRCESLLCEGEPYAVDRFGTVDEVRALTPSSVTAAWKRALSAAQIRLIVQGGAPLSQAGEAFRAGLSTLGERVPASCETQVVRRADAVRERVERMDVGQAKLVLGLRAGTAEPDEGVPAMRLMNALLGGTPHSLLFRNVREKLSLCYYCQSGYDRLKGVLLIDSGVEERSADRAKEEILRQLDAVRAGDFTDEDLESARRSVVNQFRSVGDRQAAAASWYLGQSLAPALSTPEEAAEAIGAVTREQVAAAAQGVTLGAAYLLAGKEAQ